MTFTAVIPAYNAGKYIGRTIESVLAQTRPADQIIIVDDGSKDDTAEQVRDFGAKVTLIQQENAGASVARNTGIKAATSEWIAFLDGDDEWLPNHLKTQERILTANPELVWSAANFKLCYCDRDEVKARTEPVKAAELLGNREYFLDYFSAFVLGHTGWTGTMVIRRIALFEAGLFTPGQLMANDLDMWWRIAYLHPQIGYSPKPAAIYHMQIAQSITKVHKSPAIIADLIEKHICIARKLGAYERFKPCAEHLLRFWIHKYWFDDRIEEIGNLAERFPHILPFWYRTALRVLTLSPKTTSRSLPILRRLNRVLRLDV